MTAPLEVYCLLRSVLAFDGPPLLKSIGNVEVVLGMHPSAAIGILADSMIFKALGARASGGSVHILAPVQEVDAKAKTESGEVSHGEPRPR